VKKCLIANVMILFIIHRFTGCLNSSFISKFNRNYKFPNRRCRHKAAIESGVQTISATDQSSSLVPSAHEWPV